ncbi:MAG: hypothetical protein HQ582_32570 [Planctomycetes bacterium]|nr:hypothetical protein [Planctomycetota bacterium]
MEPNRQRLREIIGAVDERQPSRLERFGDDANPALVAEMGKYTIYQVRCPVLEGVFGEGLWVRPKGQAVGHLLALSVSVYPACPSKESCP